MPPPPAQPSPDLLSERPAEGGTYRCASGEQSDYERVVRVIRFLEDGFLSQPSLAQIAEGAGLSQTACQKLFRRWCGLSPKEFVQALTLDYARKLLANEASVLDAAYESGLSSPGRLHDLFTSYEAVPPGVYRSGCEGLTFRYDVAPTPFGMALAIVLGDDASDLAGLQGQLRLAGLSFLDPDGDADDGVRTGSPDRSALMVLNSYRARWPKARFVPDESGRAAAVARGVFHGAGRPAQRGEVMPGGGGSADVILIGTPFETRVWRSLVEVPAGQAVSYSALASRAGSPRAARAVGRAVGRNPIAFVVPCHRVIGRNGGLTGYHWGLTRKRAIIGWEAGAVRFPSVSRTFPD